MDKIWDRKSFEVGDHWPLWRGWKKRITTLNRQKSIAKKNPKTISRNPMRCPTWWPYHMPTQDIKHGQQSVVSGEKMVLPMSQPLALNFLMPVIYLINYGWKESMYFNISITNERSSGCSLLMIWLSPGSNVSD